MKRFAVLGFGFVGLIGSILAGCPIYPDDHGQGSTYVVGACQGPNDCGPNETCGSDGLCDEGDCSDTGCVAGFTCQPSFEGSTCVPNGTGGGGVGGSASTSTSTSTSNGGSNASSSSSSSGSVTTASTTSSSSSSSSSSSGGATTSSSSSSSSSTSSSSGTGPVVYCGHPADCATGQICSSNGTCQPGPCSATNECILGYSCANDGTCQSETTNACDVDTDCSALGSGYECVAGPEGGGVCTAANNQCFDQSQCNAGDDCVAGKCVPACTSNADCRDGYDCNTVTGVCTVVAQVCTITNDCGSATLVCVAGACVPRSTNGQCSNMADVWDENGCVPNQAAKFTCAVDGSQGSCNAGSICLHHDCWISCDAPNQNACAQQTVLNTCKSVADNGNTYNVCGTSQNLGSQCGAGTSGNQTCTGGAVCIDGFCK